MDNVGGWAAEQLTAFLAAVMDLSDRDEALFCAVERAAETVEAEVAAFVSDERVLASIGFPRDAQPDGLLQTVAAEGSGEFDVPGLGRCTTIVVPFDGVSGGRLVVARAGSQQFSRVERNILRGLCRVLTLSLRGIETISTLRERQSLLEGLTRIQRSISLRAPVEETLQSIVAGAAELLGDDVVGLRRVDPDDPEYMKLVCWAGLDSDIAQLIHRSRVGEGAGGRSYVEGRLVTVDHYQDADVAIPEMVAIGLQTAMATPVYEDGHLVGSLVVASSTPGRVYTSAEQEALLAFADHASIALTDARTVQALRDALSSAQHDAFHDHLTALPNRALLRDRLEHALKRCQRRRSRVAVLFLDLDGFKRVNDSLGHDAGDEVLLGVAGRLQACIRDVDTLARLGGDEFAILLEELDDEGPAFEIAERIHQALAHPFEVAFRGIVLTASIGIALSDSPEDGARELLRNADLAMYQAKAAGKSRHVRFDNGMYAEILERLELESALRTALDNEEYFLEYQPIVDLTAGRTTHVEALVRWEHPQRGCLTPTSFIPVAEAIGLIVPLGDWILAEACRQATRWQHPDRPVVMSVNLSPGQISADLPDRVAKILGSTGLSPFLLTLEITEGLLMDNDEERLDALRRLQQLGVRLAVDDFGTGYSSLSRLRDLPVDQLKIDRSFVRGITDVRSGAPLVGGVVAIARGLGLSVVAEGVETHEQRLMLRKLGCHLAQGYLFGRPVRAEVMTESLRMAGPVGSTTFSPARAAVIPRARTAEEPVPLAQGG